MNTIEEKPHNTNNNAPFSLKNIPANILGNILHYVSAKEFSILQRVEKMSSSHNEIWEKSRLKCLKTKYARYKFLIDEFVSNYQFAHITEAMACFGNEANEENILLFLQLLNHPEMISPDRYNRLSTLILDLPQHTLVTYLRETNRQHVLDLLYKKFNQNLYISILKAIESLPPSPTNIQQLASIIKIGMGDKFYSFISNLTSDKSVVLQTFEFALAHKMNELTVIMLRSLQHLIEYNQAEDFKKFIDLIERNLSFLLELKYNESNGEPDETCTEHFVLINIFKELILICHQYKQYSFYDFTEIFQKIKLKVTPDFYLDFIALHIVHGNVNEVDRLLSFCQKNSIDYQLHDLFIYTAFTKQNIAQIFAVLEKYEIEINLEKDFSIRTDTLQIFLDYKKDDNFSSLLREQHSLLDWAVIGQNKILLDKLLELVVPNSIKSALAEDTYSDLIDLAFKINALTIVDHLLERYIPATLSLNNTLMLNNIKIFLSRLAETNSQQINLLYLDSNQRHKSILDLSLEINYHCALHGFRPSEICFLLLAKGADPSIVMKDKLYNDYTVFDTLTNNPSIDANEKLFINFLLKNSGHLFSKEKLITRLIQTIDTSLKTLDNEIIINNIVQHLHDQISNESTEEKIIEKLQYAAIYLGDKLTHSEIDILNWSIAFLKYEQNLKPLLPEHDVFYSPFAYFNTP